MRILLDECLPRPLARELIGHEVQTVPRAGWSGIRNSELLQLAARDFQVFITIDQRLASETANSPDLAIITLRARANRFQALRPLVPQILEELETIQPGESIRIEG